MNPEAQTRLWRTSLILVVLTITSSDGLDGWNKMQSHGKVGGQHNNSHYNNHHFNHHYNHNNHISQSRNHHYRQRRHGGNNLHHSPNDGFDVYNEWTPSKQLQNTSERNRRKGKFMRYEDDKNIRQREKVSDQNWVFVSKNASTVKAHTGSTAVLPCQVKKDSLYGMVTWARAEDSYRNRPYSVLTIGDQNYVDDKRYFVSKPQTINKKHLTWSLRIRNVNRDDAGVYECQATTHPPQAIFVRLKVVEAVARILGSSEKIIKSGSTLQLNCILKQTTEEPQYIFWYHNERMINYDKHRLVMVTKDRTGSTLTIQNASSETDSGNYTCSPDKVKPASVTVHVLRRGNSAAAVQNNERSSSSIRMGSGSMEPSVEGDDNSKTHSIRQKNTQNALPSAAVQSTAKASKMTLSFNVSSLILIALSSALSLTQRRIPILPNIILVSQS